MYIFIFDESRYLYSSSIFLLHLYIYVAKFTHFVNQLVKNTPFLQEFLQESETNTSARALSIDVNFVPDTRGQRIFRPRFCPV